MGTISLENMEFFAHHGCYEEEQKIGNKYSVTIIITTDFTQAAVHDDLTKTINYAAIYQIIAAIMQKPAYLLEHIAQKIIMQVFSAFVNIEAVEIKVSKYNPPIGGICEKATITLKSVNNEFEQN